MLVVVPRDVRVTLLTRYDKIRFNSTCQVDLIHALWTAMAEHGLYPVKCPNQNRFPCQRANSSSYQARWKLC